MVAQGDVYWLDFGDPKGRALAYRHPYVVVQGNPFNRSKIGTAVLCGITSSLKSADYPGNVRLPKGEANLTKESVVSISNLRTADVNDLVEKIGSLSSERLEAVLTGVRLLLDIE